MKMKDDLALMMKAYTKKFVGREHCFDYEDYMPKTYVMIDQTDCLQCMQVLQSELGNMTKIKWLGKIARDSHKGQGITIMTEEAIKDLLEEYEYGGKCAEKSTNLKESYLVQSFIQNPFLIKGRKFDFRVFLSVANLDPFIVLYHDGFVKIAFEEWDEDSSDWNTLIASLSATQENQKGKGMSNSEVLSEVKWTMQEFEDYLVSEGKVEKGWLKNSLRVTMRKAMMHLMRMTSHDFLKHPDLFCYFGVDFLLDDDLHMWFLEIVDQPGLLGKTPAMDKVVDETFSNFIDMQVALVHDNWELFDKIVDRSDFEWVIDERKTGEARYAGLLEPECF